jgi:hypothetical protein
MPLQRKMSETFFFQRVLHKVLFSQKDIINRFTLKMENPAGSVAFG